jgi:hypothetical protein
MTLLHDPEHNYLISQLWGTTPLGLKLCVSPSCGSDERMMNCWILSPKNVHLIRHHSHRHDRRLIVAHRLMGRRRRRHDDVVCFVVVVRPDVECDCVVDVLLLLRVMMGCDPTQLS